ncbi:hypothetical protein [Agromyces sp. LHK192]|uniref:hypothetical protein n=1 Tax=Agromyces sp. LHK192 TaxID=2498704 RepID=UPI000FDA20DD|nr:hypothetical protein [Agromyces sp. LHK192]
MNAILTKLNLGTLGAVHVVDAPESFEPVLADAAEGGIAVSRTLAGGDHADVRFALAFATTKAQVDAFAAAVASSTTGDAVVWIAYPKGSSKRYTCEFNRDTGWDTMGDAGFEPVRQVAIDDDWSALRFRRAEFITSWTRSFAYSALGKRRLAEAQAAREG